LVILWWFGLRRWMHRRLRRLRLGRVDVTLELGEPTIASSGGNGKFAIGSDGGWSVGLLVEVVGEVVSGAGYLGS